MTTTQLIEKANELAIRRYEATRPYISDRGFIIDMPAYIKAGKDNPTEAEYDNVICQSTLFVSRTTSKTHYQNRFYFRKPNGKRTNFSRAKAKEILG